MYQYIKLLIRIICLFAVNRIVITAVTSSLVLCNIDLFLVKIKILKNKITIIIINVLLLLL